MNLFRTSRCFQLLIVWTMAATLILSGCNNRHDAKNDSVSTEQSSSEADMAAADETGNPEQEPPDKPRVYSAEELRVFDEFLNSDPQQVRRQLLDDGAVISIDYLLRYLQDGRTPMVVRMIASGMDLNEMGSGGVHPLSQAVLENDQYLIDLMLERGADPQLTDDAQLASGRRLLHYAAKQGNLELMQMLLDLGMLADVLDANDQTPLDVTATYGGSEAMQLLLDNGADPSRVDRSGSVPILLAAGYGRLDALELLIASGADINYTHERGWTPLLLALQYNHEDVANYLIDNNADMAAVNGQGIGAAALAASVANAELLRRLIDAGAPIDTKVYVEGQTLIHLCAEQGLTAFIPELVDRGLDPNKRDVFGDTALDLARQSANQEAITALEPYAQDATEKDGAVTPDAGARQTEPGDSQG